MLHSRMLDYIDEVARCGSIRAAGARLHVSPSAINRQVLMIEEELGEVLFERLPRGVQTTPAGEVLLAHIRRTKQQYRESVSDMHALRSLPSGEVVIATMTGLATSIASTVAVKFQQLHPEVRISIRTMFSRDILDAIVTSEADVGLGFNIPESSQVHRAWQTDSHLGAVISAQHPLAAVRTVALSQCADYPLIFADRSMTMHDIMVNAFALHGLNAEPIVRTNSIESMKRIVAITDAVAFLSRYDTPDEGDQGQLTFRAISDLSPSSNVLSLIQRERDAGGLACRLLVEDMTSALEAARA